MKNYVRFAIFLIPSIWFGLVTVSHFHTQQWVAVPVAAGMITLLYFLYRNFRFHELRKNPSKTIAAILLTALVFTVAFDTWAANVHLSVLPSLLQQLIAFFSLLLITTGIYFLPGKLFRIGGVMTWIAAILFLYSNHLILTEAETGVLPVISVLLGLWSGKAYARGFISSFTRQHKLALWILAFCAGFAAAGNSLFLVSPLEKITIKDIAAYLLIVIWWWIAGMGFLYATVCLANRIMKKGSPDATNETRDPFLWWKFFLIPFVIWILFLKIFYPGIVADDSLVQWNIATGNAPWNDWHPVLHTLFNKLALSVWKNPASVAALQIIFMSVILARFCSFLYRRGVRRKALFILLTAFALSANNLILMITLWKDIPFAIAVLWLTLVLARIICNDYSNRFSLIADLSLALFAATLFRHNGIIITVFCTAGLLLYAWKQKSRVVFTGLSVSILLIVSFKYFFANSHHVIQNPLSIKLVVPVKGIAAVMKAGKELPVSAGFMDTILTKDQWLDLYIPYTADGYMFRTDRVMLNKLDSVQAKIVVKAYLECFRNYPRIILSDKLLGSDIAWSVPPPGYESFRYFTAIVHNQLGLQSELWEPGASIMKGYLKITEKAGFLIFWRAGLLNILLLLMAVYTMHRQVKNGWLIFLPWFAGILSLIMINLEQDYRFIYFVFVSFWFIWFFIMTTVPERLIGEEKKQRP